MAKPKVDEPKLDDLVEIIKGYENGMDEVLEAKKKIKEQREKLDRQMAACDKALVIGAQTVCGFLTFMLESEGDKNE